MRLRIFRCRYSEALTHRPVIESPDIPRVVAEFQEFAVWELLAANQTPGKDARETSQRWFGYTDRVMPFAVGKGASIGRFW